MSNDCSKIPDKHVSQRAQAHAQSLFKLKARELAKMQTFEESGGFDEIVAALANGMTQKDIARDIAHVDGSTLSIWINTRTGAQAEALTKARRAGAQACLDKSLEVLDDADQELSGSVQIAIARSKAWTHRAAVFDRTLHDRGELPTQQGSTQALPPSFSITILNGSSNQTVTIQQDADLI